MTWQVIYRNALASFEFERVKQCVTWEALWDFDLMYLTNCRNFDMVAAGDLNVRRPV